MDRDVPEPGATSFSPYRPWGGENVHFNNYQRCRFFKETVIFVCSFIESSDAEKYYKMTIPLKKKSIFIKYH